MYILTSIQLCWTTSSFKTPLQLAIHIIIILDVVVVVVFFFFFVWMWENYKLRGNLKYFKQPYPSLPPTSFLPFSSLLYNFFSSRLCFWKPKCEWMCKKMWEEKTTFDSNNIHCTLADIIRNQEGKLKNENFPEWC